MKPEFKNNIFQGVGSLNGDRQPVSLVSYTQAEAFCKWLTIRAREKEQLPKGYVFRLPTAAEWKKSHHASVIDTKKYRGNVSKCLPTKGTFSYVHIDVNGEGGFAHIVEDEIKFGRNRALQALSEGPLGNTLTNLKIPLRSDQISKHVKEV